MSLTYLLTAAGMICIPGPDVLLLTGRALQRGGTPAVRTMIGTIAGYLVITLVVAAGLGTMLARWSVLLGLLHAAAIGYLLWLAVTAWRSPPAADDPAARGGGDVRAGFLTAALNPKGLLFFLALLPPFLDAGHPAGPQLLSMGLTFCALAVGIYLGYIVLARAARRRLDLGGVTTNRVTAGALLLAAAVVAGTAVV